MCNRKLAPAALALAFGLSLSFLAGCADKAAPPVTGAVPPSAVVAPLPAPSSVPIVANSVSAAGQALTLAMKTAKVYTDLPRCDAAGATVLCSDREVVREIRAAAIKAHNAYLAARRNEALLGAAVTAISFFSNIIPR